LRRLTSSTKDITKKTGTDAYQGTLWDMLISIAISPPAANQMDTKSWVESSIITAATVTPNQIQNIIGIIASPKPIIFYLNNTILSNILAMKVLIYIW
jgi:hypothetical protein